MTAFETNALIPFTPLHDVFFYKNVHVALLSVGVSPVLQAASTTALSETQIDGNETDRAPGEGIQNKSFCLASSYCCTSATSSDIFVEWI